MLALNFLHDVRVDRSSDLSRMVFPAGQAVGILSWPGSRATEPILALGEVCIPDGVEVALDVSSIKAVALSEARPEEGGMRSSLAKLPKGLAQEISGRRWVIETDGKPVDLNFLKNLPGDSITTLFLKSPIVSDSFAAIIHVAAGLRQLYLADTGLTDNELRSVAMLKGLTYLQTWGNRFTDAGVQQLAALTNLENLYLEEQDLSAAAFSFTVGLPRLSRLGLEHVPVRPDELRELRARLPNVKVS
jgi:hypothetical protein